MNFAFDPFVLDPSRRELLCAGEPVHLQPQVFDLLTLLIANAHRVLSRDEIIEKIWNGRIVSDDAITSRVRDLRRALGDTGNDPKYVRTLRGRGIRFVGDVTLRAKNDIAQAHATVQSSVKTLSPNAVTSPLGQRPSIAVLPFQRNGDLDVLIAIEEAIPRELIATLASLRWIKVISHGSAFKFRGENVDLAEVNRILGAHYCLTGVIDLTGNRIVVDTELSDTRTSEVIWALRKTASVDDIPALRAEIAANVIAVAELEIPQHETAALGYLEAENLDAWSAMHLGFHHMSQFSQHGNALAEQMLSRAIEVDPQLSRAYAGMAFVCFQNAFMRYTSDFKISAEKARRFAEQSLSLQPRDPFGNFMMGRCHWLENDPEGSKQWFGHSISASPNYTWGYYGASWADVFTEKFSDAMESADKAIDLSPIDPFRPGMTGNKMWVYIAQKDYASAVKWAEIAARTPWAHAGMAVFAAMCHWLNGDPKKAQRWRTEAIRRNPDLRKAHLRALVPSSSSIFAKLLDNATVALEIR